MTDPRYNGSPPSMFRLRTDKKKVWRPSARKPALAAGWKARVQNVILQIRGQAHLFRLAGWAYYDHFLRFLYTIGPANAALLKNIELRGVVQLHACGENTCDYRCRDDIVHSLRLYIPVIKALCTGLEHLVLYANGDSFSKLESDMDITYGLDNNEIPLSL